VSNKVPLRHQVAAVKLELEQRKVKPGMSRSQAEYHLSRLEAAIATLEWLQANEERIKGALGT
jgi:hypothetical protein